jgi:hypothetical protein
MTRPLRARDNPGWDRGGPRAVADRPPDARRLAPVGAGPNRIRARSERPAARGHRVEMVKTLCRAGRHKQASRHAWEWIAGTLEELHARGVASRSRSR